VYFQLSRLIYMSSGVLNPRRDLCLFTEQGFAVQAQ
jgi:hypothetical protein